MKLCKPAVVVEVTRQLGYPESDIVDIDVLLLTCTLLYVIPRTSIIGAILLTGYLGGAIALTGRVVALKVETNGDIHIALQGCNWQQAGDLLLLKYRRNRSGVRFATRFLVGRGRDSLFTLVPK
jgi:hypothetical protein